MLILRIYENQVFLIFIFKWICHEVLYLSGLSGQETTSPVPHLSIVHIGMACLLSVSAPENAGHGSELSFALTRKRAS